MLFSFLLVYESRTVMTGRMGYLEAGTALEEQQFYRGGYGRRCWMRQ